MGLRKTFRPRDGWINGATGVPALPNQLVKGRIVYVKQAIVDPQGANLKYNRPLIVVTRTCDIQADASIHTVAITEDNYTSRKEVHLKLRRRKAKHHPSRERFGGPL
jgi:hypothetical protein